MTTEQVATVALIVAVCAFAIATATAILDLWVWVRVARICREMKKEASNVHKQ